MSPAQFKVSTQRLLLLLITVLQVNTGIAQTTSWTHTSCLSINQTGDCIAPYLGNRYVVAETRSNSTGTSVLQVTKIGSNGTSQGSISYNYGGQGCKPVRILADAAGNIYVFMTAGKLTNNLLNRNAVLVKFDSSLVMVWNRAVDSGGNNTDEAVDMAAETNGNILILSNIKVGTTNPDVNLRRYTPAGAFITNKNYGVTAQREAASGLKIKSNGDVVICGHVGNSSGNSGLLACFSNGTFLTLWNVSYTHSTFADDRFYDLVIDAAGNIYCGGTTKLTGSTTNMTDALLVRYNSSGIFQSARTNNKLKNDYISRLGTDASGNIYAAVFSYVDYLSGVVLTGDAKISLLKWNNSISTLLVNNVFTYAANGGSIRGFAVTPGGKSMIIGDMDLSTRPGGAQYFAIKYTTAGTRDFIDTLSVNPNSRTSVASGILHVNNGLYPNDEFVVSGNYREYGGLACRYIRKYTGPAAREGMESLTQTTPKLYPNPVKDVCRLDLSEGTFDITIYGTDGKLLDRRRYTAGELIDLQHLSAGIYLLTFPDHTEMAPIRLVKE